VACLQGECPEDKALTAQIREGQGKIFAEDLEILERQQKNLSQWPRRELLKLGIDTKTHPAWTGVHRLLDTGGQLAKFNKKFKDFGLKS